MKILEKNISTYQEDGIESSKLSWFMKGFRENISVNLDTFELSAENIPMLNGIIERISVCPFPGNNLFCYGKGKVGLETTGILFLISKENKVQIISRAPLKNRCFTIYYQNFIYLLGNNFIERLNLATYRWEKLAICLWGSCQCICTSLKNMILISGYALNDIYVLDLFTLSISRGFISLETCRTRILCTVKELAYCIDFSGKIIQSGTNNPFTWIIIGAWTPDSLIMLEYRAFFKNCWYFCVATNQVYKFDFDKGKYEIINCIL